MASEACRWRPSLITERLSGITDIRTEAVKYEIAKQTRFRRKKERKKKINETSKRIACERISTLMSTSKADQAAWAISQIKFSVPSPPPTRTHAHFPPSPPPPPWQALLKITVPPTCGLLNSNCHTHTVTCEGSNRHVTCEGRNRHVTGEGSACDKCADAEKLCNFLLAPPWCGRPPGHLMTNQGSGHWNVSLLRACRYLGEGMLDLFLKGNWGLGGECARTTFLVCHVKLRELRVTEPE